MQFTLATIAFFAAAVLASPAPAAYGGDGNGGSDNGGSSDYVPCTSVLNGQPQCCAISVLGVANLDCSPPNETPTSAEDFSDICNDMGGRSPSCCLLGVLNQGLVCEKPVGVK